MAKSNDYSKPSDSQKNQKTSKKDKEIEKQGSREKRPSETSGRRKEEKIASWEKKSRYREDDDSEFCVHFYIKNVYLSPNRRIDEFLSSAYERINKAGVCEFVQIAYYLDNEVKLSVGMKYDQDAIDILNHKRNILLYNRDQKLYETQPIIAPAFEFYRWAKKNEDTKGGSRSKMKNPQKKENASYSSKSSSKRRRKSESRKKERHTYVRKSNYDKNAKTSDKEYRSGRSFNNAR